MELDAVYKSLRFASEKIALQSASLKNQALAFVAYALDKNRSYIIEANKTDIEKGRKNGMSESLIDRLMLDDKRIDSIIASVKDIIAQTDPIGEEISGWKTPNGLNIRQVRVLC